MDQYLKLACFYLFNTGRDELHSFTSYFDVHRGYKALFWGVSPWSPVQVVVQTEVITPRIHWCFVIFLHRKSNFTVYTCIVSQYGAYPILGWLTRYMVLSENTIITQKMMAENICCAMAMITLIICGNPLFSYHNFQMCISIFDG